MKGLSGTNFNFPGQSGVYRGKVRDVYTLNDLLIIVASDRISAFDHILPKPIPYKGQVLNQTAVYFLEATRHIVPNWLIAAPDPNVSVGVRCEPLKIEMVVRGYLAGHAWREYHSGKRMLCGVPLPERMTEADAFPEPIITPATKAEEGHDEDISREEILDKGLIRESDYVLLEKYCLELFDMGTIMAADAGLILVDTKYEFGLKDDHIYLIDEVHTPDSSRYYFLNGYEGRQRRGEKQPQLSKEFVREWLMDHGFQGMPGQNMPEMPDDFVVQVSERYIELYERVTGKPFQKEDTDSIETRIYSNLSDYFGW